MAAPGYLDAASGAPLHPVAREAWLAALDDGWADPAKVYRQGRRARLLLDAARESVADNLGVRPDEVSFHGSGSDAVHAGLLGFLGAAPPSGGSPGDSRPGGRPRSGSEGRPGPPTMVLSAVEHSSVLAVATHVTRTGGTAVTVDVDSSGRVDPDDFAAVVARERPDVAVLMTANHEVGTEQPVDEVAAACAGMGVPLFVDGAQSAMWGPAPAGAAAYAGSAHKWGGPPGVGVLVVGNSSPWLPVGPEGAREQGRRAGPPDLPAVVAAAAALRAVRGDAGLAPRLRRMTARLRQQVPALVPDTVVHGHPQARVPHIAAFSFLYVSGDALQQELDRVGLSVSTGSACAAEARGEPSHVLVAMRTLTHGNLRVSLHAESSDAEVGELLDRLPPLVARLRSQAGATEL